MNVYGRRAEPTDEVAVPIKLLCRGVTPSAAGGCKLVNVDGPKYSQANLLPLCTNRRTKLEGERAVQARWPNHAILRSSIIYGPDPPLVPVERPLLLQFMDECLTAKVGALCVYWVLCIDASLMAKVRAPSVDECLPAKVKG